MYLSFELAAGCDRDASRYRISTSRLGRRRASHDSCCTCWQPAVNLSYNERDRGTQEYSRDSTQADAPLYRRI